jgi:hypothetical protein
VYYPQPEAKVLQYNPFGINELGLSKDLNDNLIFTMDDILCILDLPMDECSLNLIDDTKEQNDFSKTAQSLYLLKDFVGDLDECGIVTPMLPYIKDEDDLDGHRWEALVTVNGDLVSIYEFNCADAVFLLLTRYPECADNLIDHLEGRTGLPNSVITSEQVDTIAGILLNLVAKELKFYKDLHTKNRNKIAQIFHLKSAY